MSVNVLIPSPLRQFTGGAYAVQVEAPTVGAALAAVAAEFPRLKDNLLDPAGQLLPFVHAFVNGRDVRSQQGLATPVCAGGEVLLVQAISGG